jgi:hypothetical protein
MAWDFRLRPARFNVTAIMPLSLLTKIGAPRLDGRAQPQKMFPWFIHQPHALNGAHAGLDHGWRGLFGDNDHAVIV